MPKDYYKLSLQLHEHYCGKLGVKSKVPLETSDDLSLAYTPGVAEPCRAIAKDPTAAYRYTMKANSVAVVTDGSAVLGLGNIGALAGLPVMEGKCLLFKQFADIDAIPICLATQNVEEIIKTVVAIAPTFGGINLEDIAAPACFEVERRLKEILDIPVFHDDQHGTAIVTLAGLTNALKVVGKALKDVRIVLSGAGAAGVAITELLLAEGAMDIVLCDSKGALVSGREGMNGEKEKIAARTNPRHVEGSLADVLKEADVFIGVSAPGLVTAEMVASMAPKAIVFAMANPTPEVMPEEAKKGGAAIVATGRSDFPNQINNVLAFPGVFRGVLDGRARYITQPMLLAAAHALSSLVPHPTADKIIPSIFEDKVVKTVAQAVQ
ncbi:MAG: malic protein NAD-binding protein, malate dehydrogenase (oxaloacetate-decarboxylating) [Candidatus Peregrinibacteria bacterium GW2011_GWE2_39_6]|nr:MAG: malic protein NAD-binding protein, malate dehydrogenase (oxaloacetate-decarboxylating) [Candidatus Peregrinibacteria bacterium GW2011_GWF2_39_17]KKR26341.1 MAG: malic protein NAD-binding protein, malate dehydrogenase (oxaloacetate-decarboxylating) [Candidatus Peregrinibacteria bacterium GW2011_GWE2_39_6]HCW32830.1 NAD-dependent malic enzyme [Candidatus Peregrinibacteria bacterium]